LQISQIRIGLFDNTNGSSHELILRIVGLLNSKSFIL